MTTTTAAVDAVGLVKEFGTLRAVDEDLTAAENLWLFGRLQGLAVSLIARPPLIFLDEPTTGLDPRTRGEIYDTIRGLVADGCTVLLTTQYLDEADQLADRIAVIDRGRKVVEGTPDDLKTSVSVAKPTLDEVFPAITGHDTGEAGPAESPETDESLLEMK